MMPEPVAEEVVMVTLFTTTVYASGEIVGHGDEMMKFVEDYCTNTSIGSGRYDTSEFWIGCLPFTFLDTKGWEKWQ